MVVSISVFGDFLLNELTRLDSNCNAVTRNALNPLMSFLFMFYLSQKLKLANKSTEFERFFVTLSQINAEEANEYKT